MDLVSFIEPGELTVVDGFPEISGKIHKHPLLHFANRRSIKWSYIIDELGDSPFDAEGHRGEVAEVVFYLQRHGVMFA